MRNSARRSRRTQGPALTDSPWLAVFGAALVCIFLAGIVAVAESPRSLSDTARSPVSAGSFKTPRNIYTGYA